MSLYKSSYTTHAPDIPLLEVEGENRFLSILFSDLSGYFSKAYKLSSDEATELVAPVLRAMIEVICRHGGCVIRCLGDGILAIFGAPQTHENDAEVAILAALEIKNAVEPFGFQVKSGVNTGLVNLGWIGSELYKEIAVTGIVADLAARLQSKAKPGQVLVGKDTFFQAQRLVAGVRRRLRLKGAPEPIIAYQIDTNRPFSAVYSRKQVQKTPFVNRNRELSSLKQNALALLQGRGQAIFLWGDAGIGKSRLLSIFEDAVRSNPLMRKVKVFRIQWNEPRRDPRHGQLKTPHQPLIGSRAPFRSWIPNNIAQPNSSTRREKELTRLQRILNSLVESATSTHRGESDQKALRISGREMSRVLRSINEGSGAIVILENLHWADEQSIELIDRLIGFTSQFPILLLSVCRPGREYSNWPHMRNLSKKDDDNCTGMFIEKLSSTQSAQLVQSLPSNQSLSPDVLNEVLRRGRGNPLFLTELFSLVDAGEYEFRKDRKSSDRPALRVPSTVLRITASRISRLTQPTRRILQIASVIGPCFSTSLLSTVAGTTMSKLRRVINELTERRLITQISDKSHENYAFTEPLLHQTVYEGLQLKDRRMLHDRVARSTRSTDRSKS